MAGGGRLVVQRRRHLLVGLAFNLNVPIFPLGFVLQSQSHHLWQACISAFEALVQLVLLCLRCQFCHRHGSHVLKLTQLCDNLGVTYSTFKMLSMKQPLCFVLQALGFHCCRQGVALSCRHIAGCRNEWADSLSHNITPQNFSPCLRCKINVRAHRGKPNGPKCAHLFSLTCCPCVSTL